jgi:nucleotide-binding universal stress UspA family protein
MTYRSVLVLLDNGPVCRLRLQLAVRLARDFNCHLVGLAPTGVIDITPISGAVPSLTDRAALAWDVLRDHAEDAAQRFRDECRCAGIPSFEAAIDEEDQAISIIRHARCSDLVIVSQAHPAAPAQREEQAMVEQVVLHSARSTLVVPHSPRFTHIGSKVMVAWDDSREAARAVADALPLLQRARGVHLVSWDESGGVGIDRLRARGEAAQQWLKRHAVDSSVMILERPAALADAMLAHATRMEADLIVMGAYGHHRWTERWLGGATRDMLKSMSVPVLTSH